MRTLTEISLIVVAGGKSSRFGRDKRFVEIGGVSLLERILLKATVQDFSEIFLCVEEKSSSITTLAEKFGVKILVDEIQGAGPMSALVNALDKIKSEWALAVSCDMPFFEFESLRPLTTNFSTAKVVAPRVNGRVQPLSAFYHRSLQKIFAEELSNGQRKILSAIEKVPHKFVEIDDDANFFNVNTNADFRLALGRHANLSRKTPIISITAPASGTGKTTFIEKILRKLHGVIKIGVIKSDAHGFNLDVEGKDSWRFQNSGAKSVAVVSPAAWFMVNHTDARADFFDVADKMSDVDLILTESRTHAFLPKISLWRGRGDVIADDDTVAIFTSTPNFSTEIAQFDLNDIDAAVKICAFLSGLKNFYHKERDPNG